MSPDTRGEVAPVASSPAPVAPRCTPDAREVVVLSRAVAEDNDLLAALLAADGTGRGAFATRAEYADPAAPLASAKSPGRTVPPTGALGDFDDDTAVDGGHVPPGTPPARAPIDAAQLAALEAVAAIHTAPLVEARELIAASRRPLEKRMELLAKQLPVWPWVEGVRGFGALGLAQLVGECGDLGVYANPAKLWKRMGVAVIAGQRQRKMTDLELAELHGYSPQRRSILYVIADSLCKGNRDGEYRSYYLVEKERQQAKMPEASRLHCHTRAMRHMSKRLLRNLWRAWRGQVGGPHEEEGGGGHGGTVTQRRVAAPDPTLILEIRETHRQRQDLLRAELRLNNQVEAVYRRLTGLKAEERARLRKKGSTGRGRAVRATRDQCAPPDDERESGHQSTATPGTVAALAPTHGSPGERRHRPATQAAAALPDDDGDGGRVQDDARHGGAPIATTPRLSARKKGAA